MKVISSKSQLLIKKVLLISIAVCLVFVVTNKFVREKVLKTNKTFSEEEAPTKISSIKITLPEKDFDFLFSDMPLSNRVFQKGRLLADDQPEFYEIAIRLRGDHGWHWYKEKPSFRLKMNGNQTLYSRREIDYINPEDPSGFSNVMSSIMAAKAEIPHFLMTFGQVWINNTYKGLYLISDTKNSYNLKNYDGVPGPVVTGNAWDSSIWQNEKSWSYELVENGTPQNELEEKIKGLLSITQKPFENTAKDLIKYLDFDKTARWSAFMTLIGSVHSDDYHNNYLVYDTNKKVFCPIIADPTGFGTLTSYLNKKSAVSSVEIPIYEYLTPLFSTYFRNPEFQYKRNLYLYKYVSDLFPKEYFNKIVTNWRKVIEPLYDMEKNACALIDAETLLPMRIPVSAEYRKKDIDLLLDYYNLRVDFILKELDKSEAEIYSLNEPGVDGIKQFVLSISGNSPVKWDFSKLNSKIYMDKDLNKVLAKDEVLENNSSIGVFYPALTKAVDFDNIRYKWLMLDRRINRFVLKPDAQTYLIGIDAKSESELLEVLANQGKNAVTGKPIKAKINAGVNSAAVNLYSNTYSFHPWSKNEKN